MKIEDIKNTIDCRKQMVKYIEYLEKGNETIPEEFYIHVVHNILTKASLIALKEMIEIVNDRISDDVDNSRKTEDEGNLDFCKAKDKGLKHCLILEIKHDVVRKITERRKKEKA